MNSFFVLMRNKDTVKFYNFTYYEFNINYTCPIRFDSCDLCNYLNIKTPLLSEEERPQRHIDYKLKVCFICKERNKEHFNKLNGLISQMLLDILYSSDCKGMDLDFSCLNFEEGEELKENEIDILKERIDLLRKEIERYQRSIKLWEISARDIKEQHNKELKKQSSHYEDKIEEYKKEIQRLLRIVAMHIKGGISNFEFADKEGALSLASEIASEGALSSFEDDYYNEAEKIIT